MINDQLPPEVEKKLDDIIAQSEDVSITEVSADDQAKFTRGFSFGALVYSVIYFASMRDKLYITLSIVFGLFFPPLLIVLAINARKRAWKSRVWLNYNAFMENQKLWDKAGFYGVVIVVILSWCLSRYVYSILSGLVPNNGTVPQQLNEIQKNLQDTLGN